VRHTVGVVIPAYNADVFVAEALASVEAQSRPPDRIIVVDDGSTDRTAAVVTEWARHSSLPLTLHRQENRGISTARNAGIDRLEDADLIALLDADDVWKPWHLERCVGALERHGDVVLCFADRQPIDASGPVGDSFFEQWEIPSVPTSARADGLRVLSGPIFQSLLRGSYVPASTAVFRREAGERIGFFDPGIRRCEDRDFVLRLSRVGRFGFFREVHTHYRLHEDNVSHPRNALRMQLGGYAVLSKLLDREEDLELREEELTAVREAAHDQASTLLYTASTRGASAYLSTLLQVVRSGIWRPTLDPKNAARAVLCSLPFYRARRQQTSR
jgi:glycosyltransferase involved in cell wall biosynthesis